MAISFVQSSTGTSTASPTTVAMTNTKGNLLVVSGGNTPNTASINTPTDTLGNTYTFLNNTSSAGSLAGVILYYTICGSSGSNTITCTSAGSPTAVCIEVREYTNIPLINIGALTAFASTATASSGTAVQNAASRTPTTNSSLVLSNVANANSQTYTVGAGYGHFTQVTQGTLNLATEDQIQTVPAPIFGTFTQSGSGGYVVLLSGFLSYLKPLSNNFQFVKVGDGMSTSEKIR